LCTVKFTFIREERAFDQGYIGEVKLVDGSIPQMISFSNEIQFNNTSFQLPIHLVKKNKKEGKYLLLLNTSVYQEQMRLHLVELLRNQTFELEALDYSFFKLQPNNKKMLLLVDESALNESLAIIHLLAINKIETHLYVLSTSQQEGIVELLQDILHNNLNFVQSFDDERVDPIFDEQVIGTNLFISGQWPMIHHIKEMAYDAGFSDEEIQYNGFGQIKEKIYCVKCYSFNKKKTTNEITCESCKTVLEVSKHFSKRLDAYLGYIKVV
jgi:hypothetical protein